MSGAGDITRLLQQAAGGDRDAGNALFDCVYRELRAIASAHRHRWSGNETLNTTALINEAYVKLANRSLADYRDRTHFFATASRAMRQILINYAERVAAAKRGGSPLRVTLTGLPQHDDARLDELLQIHAVLEKLEAGDSRRCRVFECRVFGGMTIDETAAALDISPATVKRDWTLVSAWIYSEVGGAEPGPDT
jgi:RNA polymerase sigma factor (TIGR02999 family)